MTTLFLLPLLVGGRREGVAHTRLSARLNNPTPTLPCEQGREQSEVFGI